MSEVSLKTFPRRKPAVAGMFYPENKSALRDTVESLLDGAKSPSTTVSIHALVAPHAGYPYSGYVAAEGYKGLAAREFDTVVVISPSHRDYFTGVSVYPGDYETPLGVVEIDMDLVAALVAEDSLIKITELGHRQEHGIEVELPFLQTVLGDFKLVPLVMGSQDPPTSFGLGRILSSAGRTKRLLVVASSDLSHFYNVQTANRLDRRLIEDVESFDEKRLMDDILHRRCEACGYGTIVAAMMAAKGAGATSADVLSYHTSGDVSGDYDEVVGYLSAIFHASA